MERNAWICPACGGGCAPWMDTCPCGKAVTNGHVPEVQHVHDWPLKIWLDDGQLVKDCSCGERWFFKQDVLGREEFVRKAEPSQGLRNCLFHGWASIPVKTDHL